MSITGQTHAKRAREFALRERRERKKAKKEERREAGNAPEADGGDESIVQPEPGPGAEWLQ